jgi:group II intron reverse transcriptase/maturase
MMPGTVLTSLSHHIDLEWMREAYRLTRKDGAVGIDGQGARGFAENLDENLQDLLDRAKSGRYRAPAVRRVHIPKGQGKTRPIGIPTFGDKVLQRAVTMVLEPVYEQDFLDCSYGFRPGRSAHQAVQRLWNGLMEMGGGWVLDLDIRSFFDSLDRKKLQQILRRRVNDGVVTRLVGKWLNAGVMESGQLSYSDAGTPQGGVISPLLANIYLHEVLDLWFHEQVIPRLNGRAFLVRYADDVVMCFEREDDAHRVMDVLPKRLGRYCLSLHPEKTRLVEFRRPPRRTVRRDRNGSTRAGSFDFLGFTHFWARSRNGSWILMRRTAKGRLSRALSSISRWCRLNRHLPVEEQHAMLVSKMRGHFAYYGITGNGRGICGFEHHVRRIWRKWLDRRGSNRSMNWEKFKRMLERYPLPPAVVVHSVYSRSARMVS